MVNPERRASPRARFTGAVFVNTLRQELSCAASNLSETGMLLYPSREPLVDVHQPLKLKFTLPKLYRWLAIDATLVRRDTVHFQRPAWGVQFQSVTDEDRRVLRTFVFSGHGEVREFQGDFEPTEVDLDDPDEAHLLLDEEEVTN
jgi:c-di-GMP-binding flagellar brake protein YcgR